MSITKLHAADHGGAMEDLLLIPEAAIAALFPDTTAVAWRHGGANGDIYRVERAVGVRAIKVLRPGVDAARLHREVTALQTVDHPSVAAYRGHGIITHDGVNYPYIEMDWVDGVRLADTLAMVNALSLPERIEFIAQICDGVAAIGAAGVVHRDLKLLNIVVRPDGRPVIVDLGWARIIDATTITASHQRTGTLPFNSPEQMRFERVDTRSDVFAVGVIAYFVLTGAYPFVAGPGQDLIDLLQKGQATVSLLRDPAMTDQLARVVERLIAASPARRPRTGDIAAEELRRALAAATPPMPVFPRPVFLPFLGNGKEHLRRKFFGAAPARGIVGHFRLNVVNHISRDLGRAAGGHIIVDPASTYGLLPRDQAPRGYRTHLLPESWNMAELGSPAAVDAFVAPFLDCQRNAGATILISPYLDTTSTDLAGLRASLVFAETARRLADRPLLAGVSISREHLANPTIRPTLLDLLTGADIEGFYVLVGDGMTGFRQLDDRELLTGLKDLVETLRQNRQTSFFGRMGSLGICLVAAGPAGISCRVESTTMHYPDTPPQGGGGGPHVSRYYERQLLSFLRSTESRNIRGRIDDDGRVAAG